MGGWMTDPGENIPSKGVFRNFQTVMHAGLNDYPLSRNISGKEHLCHPNEAWQPVRFM